MSDTTHEHEHHVEDRTELEFHGRRVGPGWRIGEAITADGSRTFWLFADGVVESGPVPPTPKHEDLGPLPREVRLRLGLRCPAVKRDGRRCRNTVREFGGRCAAHSEGSEARA